MKSKLLFFAFLFAFLSSGTLAQLSGDYYIPQGANPQGFATLAAACSTVTAIGVKGATRFIITQNLSENAANLLIQTTTTNSSNTLTIVPATGTQDTVTMLTCTTTGNNTKSGLALFTTNYVTIDGINVQGTNLTFALSDATNGAYAINVIGSSNVTMQNFSVIFPAIPATSTGIESQYTGTTPSNNITIQNVKIGGISTNTPRYGIYTKGLANPNFSTGMLIKNNTVYALQVALDFNYFGAAGNVNEVSGNTIYAGSSTWVTSYVEGIFFADYGGTVNCFNNKILQIASNLSSTTYGMIGIATMYGALPGTILNIYNNFLTGYNCNSSYAGPLYGIWLEDAVTSPLVWPTTNIYFNTIYMNATKSTGTCTAIGRTATWGGTSGSISMKDNIFYNDNGTATSYAAYFPGTVAFASDYNDLYVSGSGLVGYYNAAACTLLTDWKTATTLDMNSVSKSVTFASIVAPFDLHLGTGSIGDAALTGQKVPLVTTDIDGDTRSAIYPYEGADEGAWLLYPIAVEGDLSNSQYITLGSKLNSNAGFGSAIDVSKLVYYPDTAHGVLYIGIQGKLDNGTNNGIGVMLGFSELAGVAAGTSLGGAPGGHYMGDATNPNFKADFPVSYMLAINPGTGVNCHVDAVKLVGTRAASYLGNCFQTDFAITGPAGASDFFSQYSVSFAFDNTGAANKGFEMRIPFSQLGITGTGTFQMFAFVSSQTAYFADVTVPGNITTGNPGFNANFNTLSGGVFHTSPPFPLPVELSSFTARMNGNAVVLNWKTATEQNNNIFEIERSSNGSTWVKIGSVQGSGNSNTAKSYSFTDSKLSNTGKYSYRLKQVDNSGSFKYSNVTEVNYTVPTVFSLSQNYPNPFNPNTIISYSLPQASNVKLSVYNALGQMVKVLENESKEAGTYNISFNASELSSGIYFYKIEAGQFSQTRKMMLVK